VLQAYFVERSFDGGEYVFREGDTDRSLFLLRRGGADLTIPIPGEVRRRRLSTVSKGTIMGEVSLFDGLPRSAGAQATGPLLVYELTHHAFERISEDHPKTAIKIQAGIARSLSAQLRSANALIIELDT